MDEPKDYEHDDLCADSSTFINGLCLGCEAIRAVRDETVHRIEVGLRQRWPDAPTEVWDYLTTAQAFGSRLGIGGT